MAGSVIAPPKPGISSISYGRRDPKWNFFFKDLLYLFPFWEGAGVPRDIMGVADFVNTPGNNWVHREHGWGWQMGGGMFYVHQSEVPKLDPMTYMQLRRIDHDGSTSGATLGMQWNDQSASGGYRWSWYSGNYRLLVRNSAGSSVINDLAPGAAAQDTGDYILLFTSHNSAGTNRGFTSKTTFFNLTKKASDSYQEQTWNRTQDLTNLDRNWTNPLTFGRTNPTGTQDQAEWQIAATWQRELSSEERRKIAEDPFGPLRPFTPSHIKAPAVGLVLRNTAKIFDMGSNAIRWKSAPYNMIIRPQ